MWVRCFTNGAWAKSDIEFEAMLDILAFLVCITSGPEDELNPFVFSLLRLAGGDKLALTLLYLGSLFYHFDECVYNITRSMGRYLVVTYADTSFLQLFLWKRFKTLGLKPAEYEAVEMIDIEDDNGKMKTLSDRTLKMRAQRWSNLKQHKLKRLSKLIDSEKHFNFRPYTFTHHQIVDAELYATLGGGYIEISTDEVPISILTWLAIILQLFFRFLLSRKWDH